MTGVCYIAPDVEVPYFKGSSTHVLELSRALADAGHTVHVIARRGKGSAKVEEIDGVVFHRVYRGILRPLRSSRGAESGASAEGGRGLLGRGYHLYLRTVFAIYVAFGAARLVKSLNLDVIVERETAFGAGAIASMITGKPMVLEMIGPRFSSLSMSRCSKLLAYNKKMVPKDFLAKAVFVKAAVNLALFKPDSKAGLEKRKELGLDGKVMVGYVGSFIDWHGVGDLLDAAEIVEARARSVDFLLVGPHGEQMAQSVAKRGLSDCVHMVGPVPYGLIPSYVNACDMLVAPYNTRNTSRSERGIGSPLKVLEYMACGKPAIGSDLPQVTELIEDGRNGLLFPEGDVASLAGCIMELVDDPSYRQQLGAQALGFVSAGYSWSSLARQIGGILDELNISNG